MNKLGIIALVLFVLGIAGLNSVSRKDAKLSGFKQGCDATARIIGQQLQLHVDDAKLKMFCDDLAKHSIAK